MNKCRLTIKGTHHCRQRFQHFFFFWFYHVLLHFHSEVPLFLTLVCFPSPTLPVPRKQHKWTHFCNRRFPVPITGFAAAAGKPLQTFVTFVHKETFAFVGKDHRKGIISNNMWFLWRRGRLQRWDFSCNEGRLPGAGVWDKLSLTLACETIKVEEICHCRSTQRCEKREIKLEEDLFYHLCRNRSGWNPTTVCFYEASLSCNTNVIFKCIFFSPNNKQTPLLCWYFRNEISCGIICYWLNHSNLWGQPVFHPNWPFVCKWRDTCPISCDRLRA